jgi:CHAT domain-containing protein
MSEPVERRKSTADLLSREFPWLRRFSLHVWAAWQCRWVWAFSVTEAHAAKSPEKRNQLVANLVGTLLGVGEALSPKGSIGTAGRFRAIGFLLRAWHYNYIVSCIAALPAEWTAGLSEEQLIQVIRFARLALEYYEAVHEKVMGKPRAGKGLRVREQRRRIWLNHASHHATLATAYLRFNVGDVSRNMETAFEHYRSAAKILEQEDNPLFSLCSAGVWTTLGTALLSYPTENRPHYARQALEAFQKAKEIVAPHAALMKTPSVFMRDQKLWRQLSFLTGREYASGSVTPLRLGDWRMFWGGVPDAFVSGAIIPFFPAWIEWQHGVAHHYLGQLERVIEHLDLALRDCPNDADVRTAIELSMGFAYLEIRTGDRRNNLVEGALPSFKNALATKDRLRSQRVVALAALGYARTCLEMDTMGALNREKRKEILTRITNELRAAARTVRKAAMPQLAQEALFLLGKAYELQGDYVRSYRALALSSRMADRLERRARTPRMARYLVGTEAPLDATLVRMALYARVQSEEIASKGKGKPTVVPLRFALRFAERGRTVFLATQLRGLNLLPTGASEEDARELFERRRLWHEAELRLVEQESAPGLDDQVLVTSRERRNRLESGYFAELERIRKKFSDSHYDPDRPVLPVRTEEIREILSEFSKEGDTALVEYFFTDQHLVVFILFPTSLRQEYVDISRDELAAIEERWEKGCDALKSPEHWELGYLLQILNRLQPAAEVPAKSIADYEETTGRQIKRIVVVPHRFLHLIPLHAIELTAGKRWGESVSIQYAPSASALLWLLRSHNTPRAGPGDRPSEANHRKALCVSYSSPADERSLLFNFKEAQAVAEETGGEFLSGREATPSRVKEAMRDAAYIHFACHGTFDRNAPLDAALELAPDTESSGLQSETRPNEKQAAGGTSSNSNGRLTLGEIFRSVSLPRTDVVVLSACETGVTKVEERHEEYIGLPAGFLYAGASTVISTLWPVADVGTWLLMRAFARHVASGVRPAAALRCAQRELRGLSAEYVQEEIGQAAQRESDPCRRERMIEQAQQLRDPFPFSGPYWWAGFTVNGLG